MPLIETGASASLDMGAVADGQYLKRSGTSLVGATLGSSGSPSSHTWMYDAFAGIEGTVIGQGAYTECGAWADDTLAAGSTATATGGVLTLSNHAAAGAITSTISSTITSPGAFNFGGRIHFKMRLNQNASGYGGGVRISDGTNHAAQIYFRYSTTFQIAFWNGYGYKLQDANKDQWYTIDAVWSGATNGVEIFIDGAWAFGGSAGTYHTLWNKLKIYSASAAGGADCDFNLDDFHLYSLCPLGA